MLARKGREGVVYLHTAGISISFETVGIHMLHMSQKPVHTNNDCINNIVNPQVLVASFQVLVAVFKRDESKSWKVKTKVKRLISKSFSVISLRQAKEKF